VTVRGDNRESPARRVCRRPEDRDHDDDAGAVGHAQGREWVWEEATYNKFWGIVCSVCLLLCIIRHKHWASSRPLRSANCEAKESTVRDGVNGCRTNTTNHFFLLLDQGTQRLELSDPPLLPGDHIRLPLLS
jgi:hypothetical protein